MMILTKVLVPLVLLLLALAPSDSLATRYKRGGRQTGEGESNGPRGSVHETVNDTPYSTVCLRKLAQRCSCYPDLSGLETPGPQSPAIPGGCCEPHMVTSYGAKEVAMACLWLPQTCRSVLVNNCAPAVLQANLREKTTDLLAKCNEGTTDQQRAQVGEACALAPWVPTKPPACVLTLLTLCNLASAQIKSEEAGLASCEATLDESLRVDFVQSCAQPQLAQTSSTTLLEVARQDSRSLFFGNQQEWADNTAKLYFGTTEGCTSAEQKTQANIDRGNCGDCWTSDDCIRPYGEWCISGPSGVGWCVDVHKSTRECFPGRAQATLEDGSLVAMDQVRVGDRVHVGGGRFEPLLAIIKHEDARVHMVSLEAGNRTLQLTSNHRVQVVDRDGRHQMVAAGEVRVRDLVVLADSLAHVLVETVRVTSRKETVYSPWTASQRLDVDGLMVSTRGSDSKSVEAVDTVALALFQALQRVLPRTTYEALHDTLVPAYSFIGSKVRHASLGPSSLGATVAALLLARQRLLRK